jgi:5-methylcytosine-specific restriction enzyme subunit McrC
VRFDEYTINNPLNKIFKTLLFQLLTKTNNKDNKKKLTQGLTYLQDVDMINLSSDSFTAIKFDRLNTEFEPLFNLARLFFYNQQPGLNAGQEKTFSFLIPVNELFEHFVGKVLTGLSNDNYTFHVQKNRKYLLTGLPNDEILLKPDFSLTRNKQIVSILDAKYKSPFNNEGKVDLKESDVY